MNVPESVPGSVPGSRPLKPVASAQVVANERSSLACRRAGGQFVAIVLIAAALFTLNNLAVVSGWLHTPAGFIPMFLSRATDFAQYVTWAEGFRTDNLIPNYHYPLPTDNGFFNPFFWAIGKVMNLTGLPFPVPYHVAHFAITVLAVASIWMLVRSFAAGRQLLAVGLIFCVIPLQSAFVPVAALFAPESRFAVAGLGDVVFPTSDGVLHGISGGALVTLGTAATVYAFVLLHRFITESRGLGQICFVSFAVGFLHPFESVTIAGIGGPSILLLGTGPIHRRIRAILMLGGAAALGMLPYVAITFSYDWVQTAANLNRWDTPGPFRLYMMLGLPAVLATVLLPLGWVRGTTGDRLLTLWFAGTIILLYVPLIPWSQHLLDGFHYATPVLLARQITLTGIHLSRPRSFVLVLWMLWSAAIWSAYYVQSYQNGMRPEPKRLFSSLQSTSERDAIEWLRANAPSSATLLAPPDLASWYATVPIRTLASHYLFSLDYKQQAEEVRRFYAGEFSDLEARAFLDRYRIRYIVVPTDQSSPPYLADLVPEVSLGTISIFDVPR